VASGSRVRVIGGVYRIGELLGSGGMGDVYAAVGPGEQDVAIKILRPAYAEHHDLLARFRREARIAARIVSPRVARVLGAGKDRDGQLWIAFERLYGESLEARLKVAQRLPLEEVAWVVDHVLEGLSAAHAIGAVHRDVKPGNVFVESKPRGARLLDFGVSKLRDPSVETESPNLTHGDETLGTPTFMAPEQAEEADVDARADLYSLGVLAFVSLAGSLPFAGRSAGAIWQSKRHADARTLSEVTGTAWPEPVERFLRTSLARDPGRRFASADEARLAWRRAAMAI
jgi:eukaryotic-like serine/threonine-protein kinase